MSSFWTFIIVNWRCRYFIIKSRQIIAMKMLESEWSVRIQLCLCLITHTLVGTIFKIVLGTTGRLCERKSRGSDGCRSLCCMRGYSLVKRKNVFKCNCTFNWCCFVECNTCETEEWISVCKWKYIKWLKNVPYEKCHSVER